MAQKNYKNKTSSSKGSDKKNTTNRRKGNNANSAGEYNSESGSILKSFLPFANIILIILITVSFFVPDFGMVGNFIRDKILFGLFSSAAYLLPVVMIACTVVHFTDQKMFIKRLRYVLFSVLYLLADSLFHIIRCSAELIDSVDPVKHYNLAVNEGLGGGAVGGFIGGLFVKCFSKTGASIIIAALLISLIIVIIGITPKEIWNRISDKGRGLRDRMEADRLAAEADRAERDSLRYAGQINDGSTGYVSSGSEFGTKRNRQRTHEENYEEYNNGFNGEYDEGYDERYNVELNNGTRNRKTEFDPTLTDEDFPVKKEEQLPIPPEKTLDDIKSAAEHEIKSRNNNVNNGTVEKKLEPEAEITDSDEYDVPEEISVFDNPEDEELVKRLSREYLGEGFVTKEKDLTPSLKNGEVLDIPQNENKTPNNGNSTELKENKTVEPEKQQYVFPDINLLSATKKSASNDNKKELVEKETTLIKTLEKFNVKTESAGLPAMGPTITRYELRPMPGTRVRSIVNLADDIALSLATSGIRIEAPIPGKSAVGIEVPNDVRQTVNLRKLLEKDEFINSKTKTTVALGEDVAGEPVFFDITKMPHLLIAGATGMGKSVCINCLIVSMLYKASPDDIKLILIDPKKVEFNMYSTLPHLLVPVVSDPKKAAGALSWAVNEMERRFSLIESAGVRNIFGYNEAAEIDEEREKLPHIVIIIDELADLMMTASDSVEDSICRLAQKARAAGMHLIIGTQRPSVDVITGTIKSNIPSRIACTVASQIDSRTILDMVGAEKLIGMGDMLFSPVGFTKPIRVQGAFVSDDEVENIVAFITEKNKVSTSYSDDVMTQIESEAAKCVSKKQAGASGSVEIDEDEEDPKFWEAVEIAVNTGKISTSLLQRKCSVGFGRGAKLIDRMEELGFVSAPDGQKPRQVKITKEQLQLIKMGASSVSDDDGTFDEEEPSED